MSKPWEKYANYEAEVTPEQVFETATGETSPTPASKPWEKYADAQVEEAPVQMNGEFSGLVDRAKDMKAQEEAAVKQTPDMGGLMAAAQGAGNAATLGFNDEIMAPVNAAAGMAFSDLPDEEGEEGIMGTWKKYQRLMQTSRDASRENLQAAQDQHPGAYMAGSVAGGIGSAVAAPAVLAKGGAALLGAAGTAAVGARVAQAANAAKAIPGVATAAKVAQATPQFLARPAAAAVTGGAESYVAGLGEGEGDLSQRMDAGDEAAEAGATFSGGLSTLGQLIRPIKAVGRGIKNSAIGQTFTRGAKGEDLVSEEGRKLADQLGEDVSKDFIKDTVQLRENAGKKIGRAIDQLTEEGHKIDYSDEIPVVLEKLKKIQAEAPTAEAKTRAAAIEYEIRSILKIPKDKVDDTMYGVSKADAPEGLLPDTAPKVAPKFEVTPKEAQTLTQKMYDLGDYSGADGAYVKEPATIASNLRKSVRERLDDSTGLNEPVKVGNPLDGEVELPSVNQQYKMMDDLLSDELKLKPNDQTTNEMVKKISNLMEDLAKDSTRSGRNSGRKMRDVLDEIRQIDPAMAAKYEARMTDASQRIKLTDQLGRGLDSSFAPIASPKAAIMVGANKAGLALDALGVAKPISKAINATSNVANNGLVRAGLNTGYTQGTSQDKIRETQEPYKMQQRVAKAAEGAEPEVLTQQATDIRSKHGKEGERLASILDNMAKKDKNARRALMFTVMQDPNHRKMLGLTGENE